MSASLVGSEMCIRDRQNFRPDLGVGMAGPRGDVRSAHRAKRDIDARLCVCLLYTSDAADDM
eukprot:7988266-Alexandrium_andersonii.AAC.1